MAKPRVIYWFRTDLRLHDSPALKAALDLSPEFLYPIWTWDPHYVYRARVGVNRWQFLIDCQNDLSASITKLNKKSKLLVIREAPTTLLPKLFKAWRISHLVFEKDTDAYARQRDNEVMALAEKAGVKVITRVGRTLYDPDRLVQENGGPTMSITQVQKAAKKIGEIPRPIPAPTSLPDPGDTFFDFEQEQPPSNPDMNANQRDQDDASYAHLAGPKGDFSVPTMAELGLKPATTPHRGGETLALNSLSRITADKKYTATFEKPKTAPTDFDPQSTTLLSPHLHFGSLSVRTFYWAAQDIVTAYGPKASVPPTSLTGQLLFRDMYFGAQASLGHRFSQTHGNSHVRFIPWHLPSTLSPSGLTTGDYTIDDPQAETWFQRWRNGLTGFPWIDALMRQLRQEGWIHHLGRHAVACFLTRGGCYISWERGAEVFEEWLIDHEVACNAGNWQWLSCTAFYSQFFRCYSPIAFPQKTDRDGAFVRRYVPELKDFPVKYIYEPWKAPVLDQKKAGCLIQGDATAPVTVDNGMKVYPKPMFDFGERRTVCIDGMKEAYKVGLYGDHPRVLDNSWKALFDDKGEGPTAGKPANGRSVREGVGERDDGTVEEDMGGAADKGGDNRSGDKGGNKRKMGKGQGTLDAHVKRARK
ncbi:MAG: hypothetical protein M1824_004175 [Vezdaea acicularis]|nr:MAG: hypothetical protein M1824_004175 [Vezdaea acicularis]